MHIFGWWLWDLVYLIVSNGLDTVKAGDDFRDTLIKVGVSYNEQNKNLLGTSVDMVGQFHSVIDDLYLKLVDEIKTAMVDSMKSLVQNEIKNAKNQKSMYDSSRSKLNGYINELNAYKKSKKPKDEKISQMEASVEEAKVAHTDCGMVTVSTIQVAWLIIPYIRILMISVR